MDYQSLAVSLLNRRAGLEDAQRQLASQISTGNRLVLSKIDPSGLAITKGMDAQIRGINVSQQNMQEALRMLDLADSALDGVSDILMRMRDLAVRMANEATSNTRSSGNPAVIISSDQRNMYDEMGSLATEIRRVCGGLPLATPPFIVTTSGVNYNGKDLFFDSFDSGQLAQIGPNNNPSNTYNIVIPSMTAIASSMPVPPVPLPGNFTAADFRDFALQQITALSGDIESVSNIRNVISSQSSAITKIISDSNLSAINLTDAKSRIDSTNIESAVVELSRNLVIQSTMSTAMIEVKDMRASQLQFLSALPTQANKE